ncbi:crossover junction endodeoxyribonuclease RuvC [Devosia rhodophyticola]|uniref:Crossover junction endodeoxyribonuclease RuvC n=1 Tax=Devosia rhodophyticola TaxID=3026423 RepID=A0ABY7YUJ9_9HYPH|nr:crossover junction endodeoxyribonuclease RuvC [Devosia rhodophyticola]WDR04924.1 crossover junction endodeoxyribonuclease RuvC [Devosia rhodophyticola]
MTDTVRIMGIDPGLRRCGWGVIETRGNRLSFVACGTLTPPTDIALADRLVHLFKEITALVDEYQPDEAAVEETFVSKGAQSALLLGQARGIALMTPAARGVPVSEYAANLIKKSVVGTGHAEKDQVAAMIRILLPTARFKGADAADALAIGICHAHHRLAAMRLRASA